MALVNEEKQMKTVAAPTSTIRVRSSARILLIVAFLVVTTGVHAKFARFNFEQAIDQSVIAGEFRVMSVVARSFSNASGEEICGYDVTLFPIEILKGETPKIIRVGSAEPLAVGSKYFVALLSGQANFPEDFIQRYPPAIERRKNQCEAGLPDISINWLALGKIRNASSSRSGEVVSRWLKKPYLMDVPDDVSQITVQATRVTVNDVEIPAYKLDHLLVPDALWHSTTFVNWDQLKTMWRKMH